MIIVKISFMKKIHIILVLFIVVIGYRIGNN